MAWNPRYICYAKASGRSAADQLAHDKEQWPGGCMTGFFLWMNEQLGEFFRSNPNAFGRDVTGRPSIRMLVDHDAWDRWLKETACTGTR